MTSNKVRRIWGGTKQRFGPEQSGIIWRAIPSALLDTLTARQLSAVIDVMHDQFEEGKRWADRDSISTGAVWDTKHNRFIELVKAG